jgi:hypothetical protein
VIGRIAKVRKRDGRLVDFDESKIADAIYKAAVAVGGGDRFLAEELAGVVTLFLEKQYAGKVPNIEEIQDMVEKVLIETGHARTAKAYILYRDRRARARSLLEVRAEGGADIAAGPRVGNPRKALVSSWNKARIAEALVREADLDRRVAEQVASRVEEKVFAGRTPRITTSQIRSLVEAELFLLGYSDRVGRQSLVGLPRYDVDLLLRGGKGAPWRPMGPSDLKRSVADALLAQYALAEVYAEEVVAAHLEARLHILDAGCPFEWIAAAGRTPPAEDPDAWVEGAALLAARLGGVASREAVLEGLTTPALRWPEGPRARAAIAAVRRLLGHAALRTLDPRGGRFRLCLDVPLASGDETSELLADALVREQWALFREGSLEGLPELSLHLPAAQVRSDAARRALLPALGAAAETGRIRFVLERDLPSSLATSLLRVSGAEAAEERAAAGGAAVAVAGAVALDLAGLAAELEGRGEKAFLEALESLLVLGIKALRQKRNFLATLASDPSTPLYRVAAGARPLVAGGRGFDLVHLVGVRTAATLLEPDAEAAAKLALRIRGYAALRLAEEGRQARLKVVCASDRDGEASARLLAADRARHPCIASLFRDPAAERYFEAEPFAIAEGALPPHATAQLEPVGGTLELNFPRESAPEPEALLRLLAAVAEEPRVHVFRPAPWPDRRVRSEPPSPSDL